MLGFVDVKFKILCTKYGNVSVFVIWQEYRYMCFHRQIIWFDFLDLTSWLQLFCLNLQQHRVIECYHNYNQSKLQDCKVRSSLELCIFHVCPRNILEHMTFTILLTDLQPYICSKRNKKQTVLLLQPNCTK